MSLTAKSIFLICAIVNLLIASSQAANILAFLPSFSPSHLIIETAVARVMAEHGHNVTVVSALPLKQEWLHPSMQNIQIDPIPIDLRLAIKATQTKGLHSMLMTYHMFMDMADSQGKVFEDKKFLQFLHNPGNKFDLMLYGYVFGDVFFGMGEHFQCPIALMWPNVPITVVSELAGNPLELTYTPASLLNMLGDTKGIMFRFQNLAVAFSESILNWATSNRMRHIYEKHFPSDRYASYEKARERVSMVLFSHHFTEKPVRPLVPAFIEIGGIHLNDEPQPLPKDIAAFVDTAEHGVIFFSLGTNVKSEHLQPNTLKYIYNVLSKLPQKVLWKCDDESQVPGNASNILYRKWLPQADILGHPNVKLFFGHGGKGGITEAKFYGVPMVGLPIFGDQPSNMEEVVYKGYGLSIANDENLSEEVISQAIQEVLHNRSYADTIKKFSQLYRDRPMKVKDTVVYWLEYLIRHKGAPHMQSPLKTMNFIEKTNLDVIAFLLAAMYVVVVIVKFVFKFIFKFIFGAKRKSKKD